MDDSLRPMASYWSIAGDCYPGGPSEVSPFGFAARVETAAAAGFRGIGLVHQDIEAVRKDIGLAEMRRILEVNGIVDVEVEILSDWFAAGERRRASDAMRADLLAAGEALGARHLKISGDMAGAAWPDDVLVREFAALCDEAARAGLLVGIEIMPWANLSSIANTMAVVEPAGRRNGGLLLDTWHMVRGNIDLSEIGRLPAGAIISVELDDADEEPVGDLWNDTLHHRRLCGQGCFDLRRFMAEVKTAGYAGPVGVEILSEEHRKKPLAEEARLAFKTLRPYLN